MSRRALLRASTALSAGAALSAGYPALASTRQAQADDFTTMRQQWRALHVAEGYDPQRPDVAAVLNRLTENARGYWTTMATGAGRTYLWEDSRLDAHQSFAISRSFERLYWMALAYSSPGAGLAGDTTLLADIVAGLDWMVANYYREDGEQIGNWYEWMISGPAAFNNAAVLLYDQLTAEQIGAYTRATANYTPEPIATAANRALTASIVVGRGTLASDGTTVALGVDGLPPVLSYVTRGDGFYTDGSFIQHDYYPYIGAYGASILDALSPIINTVAGTRWQVDAPVAYEWLRDACDPVIWNGALMDMVSGRTIARWNEHEHYHAHYVLKAALALTPGAPAEHRDWLLSVCKEWLLDDGFDDPTPTQNVPILLAATSLRTDDSVPRRGKLVLSKVFHNQDRIVHRRPHWAYGISMCSNRIANFESINAENLRGWITADGVGYLYLAKSDQFMRDFWATVDHARMPGATVDVRTRQPSEGRGTRGPWDWAGGATIDNYTAGGMSFEAQGGSLVCKKSWFCFDDEVVALGSGITASDGRPVETVVENRRLGDAGTERVSVNGATTVPDLGSNATVPDARWLHLEGTGGYVFFDPTALRLKREARTGRWADVTQHPVWARTDPITRNYLTAWLEHGVDPSEATYAYALLPTATGAETESYAKRPAAEVLANSLVLQAVRHAEAGVLVAANFWQPGTAGVVTTTGTGSVVVREDGDELRIGFADPTRKAAASTVTIDRAVSDVVSVDDGLEVTSTNPLTVSVDLSGSAGATRTLRCALA